MVFRPAEVLHGLKPGFSFSSFAARLKSCLDYKAASFGVPQISCMTRMKTLSCSVQSPCATSPHGASWGRLNRCLASLLRPTIVCV